MATTTFAEELKRWRHKMRLTQEAAAKKLEVHYDSLRDWELGRCEPRNIGPVRRVMRLLLDEAKDQHKAKAS